MAEAVAPRLIIGIGNPSRGDDALGSLCIERLQALQLPDTELLTDFQLQIEYVLDLLDRDEVIFVDAAASGAEPYTFGLLAAQADHSVTTHAVSPSALLATGLKINGHLPPNIYMLAIRGYSFELGDALSMQAADNLEQAMVLLERHIAVAAMCPT
ncbi:MAG: hydrogenase maturation protease [Gallionella sp.]